MQPIQFLYRNDVGAVCGADFLTAMPGLKQELQDPFHLLDRISRVLHDSHAIKGEQSASHDRYMTSNCLEPGGNLVVVMVKNMGQIEGCKDVKPCRWLLAAGP